MRNVRMTVSYDGTAYCGFQTQPGLNTVQEQLEQAIKVLTGEDAKITASGRTDAGVHARGQVFNFYTESQIPIRRWSLALNARLPEDIVVRDAVEVPEEFHSTKSAIRKTYRYTIRCGKHPDLFKRHLEFHHPSPLNVNAMREGLQHLLGEHEFTSYCSTRTTKTNHFRTIYEARVECEPYDAELQSFALHIILSGNGFLYNMVRIIAGTLIQVGQGKRNSLEMKTILDGKNRKLAGPTAVAHGLMLWEVFYDDSSITT
ncbi:tRNA pseudouridine(38-40) synthase TruA [Paenibacillus cremeus]|uniref:tRNA pseudouridine synthase A n=1 Tax=Paenibacillus cremeus TaxID=2163881 RepID=A0A559K3E3_9BACL|nr:tRNA pseudouridine(38-40) synthase TruA [Paenibacillus cremeus]TVY06654.1 tRNA pseudouridine(38-40) synthase TruA [Paenibacillus cremeus]